MLEGLKAMFGNVGRRVEVASLPGDDTPSTDPIDERTKARLDRLERDALVKQQRKESIRHEVYIMTNRHR